MRDREKEIIKLKADITTYKRSAAEIKEEPQRKDSRDLDT
jgi:hypothetical protein